MNKKVEVGDIVTIISDESCYKDKQGQVVEIVEDGDADGSVGVKFRRDQMMHYVATGETCIVRHKEEELRIDKGWSLVSRATMLYGRMYHHTVELRFDFDVRNPCMHEGCNENAEKRCVVNVWGTVIERDLCKEHGKIDGLCMEIEPPIKRDYVPATPIRPLDPNAVHLW